MHLVARIMYFQQLSGPAFLHVSERQDCSMSSLLHSSDILQFCIESGNDIPHVSLQIESDASMLGGSWDQDPIHKSIFGSNQAQN